MKQMTYKAPQLSYRPDIDGLRAIAVLLVVFHHAFPATFPSGFIGVDIFFVISGFLITSILIREQRAQKFSIIQFYNRRIRRIFPSLLVLFLLSIVFSWFYLLQEEFEHVGKHIFAGSLFSSNFLLRTEGGYFDTDSELKPFLHLWSLSIEEQFYLIWPLIIGVLFKKPRLLLFSLVTMLVLSFAYCIYASKHNPSVGFYWPTSRFWELFSGCALAFIPSDHKRLNSKRWGHLFAILGATLLILGCALIKKDSVFPGYFAALPVAAALLIILAGKGSYINAKILAHPALVWVGLISYPLYLFHWPLLSFAKIVLTDISSGFKLLLILTAVVLSWLAVKLIEQPIRHFKSKKTAPALLLSMILMTGLAFSIYKNKGYGLYGMRKEHAEFSSHFENALPKWAFFEKEQILAKYREECNFYDIPKLREGKATTQRIAEIQKDCFTRDTRARPKAVLIWGDSHAQQLNYGLSVNLPKNWQILQVASSGCNPQLKKEKHSQNYCDYSNYFALKTLKDTKPDVVIVGQNSGHSIKNMQEMSAEILRLGVKRVLFTGPTPHWKPNLPKIIERELWYHTPERTFIGIDQAVIETNNQINAQFVATENIKFINITKYFCNDSGCLTRIGDDRKTGITTWDYGHLTPAASNAFARDVLASEITNGF